MEFIKGSQIPNYLSGFAAAALSFWFLYHGRSELPIVVASSFFLLISITDTLYHKIFNASTLALIIVAAAINLSAAGISGLIFTLNGFLAGLALLIVPYLFGGMGAGDVKALAALGALIGASQIFQVFLYTALIGGLLGLAHYIFSPAGRARCRTFWTSLKMFVLTRELSAMREANKSGSVRFPYAAAIAFGFFSYLSWGRIL